MDDKLETIFSLQKNLERMMNLDRYPKDTQGKISALCTAIIHEAVELQMTTSWKWWKKPIPLDEAAAREELIDIWHFVVQASIELNMTPGDILKEYQKKHQINKQRQIDGY
ncbi:MAG: dUTPase [Thaumarchaeota archaeon 13_1_40CM_2_39_13_2]|nr:MAG: dUTPase [Thaumarchaeota archaeon 13_1_40CM_2_39_13_2]OLE40837.1 MAG: dUTPase [Thaumarchaeota archaeon 13_1_20CM_2_39_20]